MRFGLSEFDDPQGDLAKLSCLVEFKGFFLSPNQVR